MPDDESTESDTLCDSEESKDEESVEIQNPTSQNDEADACLVHAAWLRKTLDNVYMSNRRSMNLRAYIHAAHRRTKAPRLAGLWSNGEFHESDIHQMVEITI